MAASLLQVLQPNDPESVDEMLDALGLPRLAPAGETLVPLGATVSDIGDASAEDISVIPVPPINTTTSEPGRSPETPTPVNRFERPKTPRSPQAPRRSRFVTYVAADDETAERQSAEQSVERRAIEVAGMGRVCDHERAERRLPQPMPPNHPGYDIESADESGHVVRYIEVKSVSGSWGSDGVGLTATQFAEATTRGESYWLYVVEQADTDDFVIHRIQNPAGRANRFFYDHGWREIGETGSDRSE